VKTASSHYSACVVG